MCWRWWDQAWSNDPALAVRFQMEVVAALPVSNDSDLEEVFAGLEWRRLRLRPDQLIEEWDRVPIAANPSRNPSTKT
jgi:hypothetical protein